MFCAQLPVDKAVAQQPSFLEYSQYSPLFRYHAVPLRSWIFMGPAVIRTDATKGQANDVGVAPEHSRGFRTDWKPCSSACFVCACPYCVADDVRPVDWLCVSVQELLRHLTTDSRHLDRRLLLDSGCPDPYCTWGLGHCWAQVGIPSSSLARRALRLPLSPPSW